MSSLYTHLSDEKLDFHLDIRIVQHFVHIDLATLVFGAKISQQSLLNMSRSAGHSFLLESLSKGSGSDLRDSTGHRLRSGMGRGRANFENSWRADPKRAIQDG